MLDVNLFRAFSIDFLSHIHHSDSRSIQGLFTVAGVLIMFIGVFVLCFSSRESDHHLPAPPNPSTGSSEEKREAIKHLCVWTDYHRSRADFLTKLLSDLLSRNHRPVLFDVDVDWTRDGETYAYLLNVLAPEHCSPSTLDTKDPTERANLVLEHAEKTDCKRYLASKDIVEGSTNLNLAFVAHTAQDSLVTLRRWIYYCNRVVSKIITKWTGGEDWVLNTEKLAEFRKFTDNEDLHSEWKAAKRSNKIKVVPFLKEKTGYSVSPCHTPRTRRRKRLRARVT
ncbi:hypothetical protein Lser_V15G38136 [Lactuca serriola]